MMIRRIEEISKLIRATNQNLGEMAFDTSKFLSLKNESDELATNLIKTLDDDTENVGSLQAQMSNKSKFGRNSFVIHQNFRL